MDDSLWRNNMQCNISVPNVCLAVDPKMNLRNMTIVTLVIFFQWVRLHGVNEFCSLQFIFKSIWIWLTGCVACVLINESFCVFLQVCCFHTQRSILPSEQQINLESYPCVLMHWTMNNLLLNSNLLWREQ